MTAPTARPEQARPSTAISAQRLEDARTHLAACRYRRQELVCSQCGRATRLIAAVERSQDAEAVV